MCVYNYIPLRAQMPLLVPSTLWLVLLAKVVNFCILMAWVGVFFDGLTLAISLFTLVIKYQQKLY